MAKGLVEMRHYIALIHKDTDSGYGVSFPDVPGVVAVAETLDEALVEAEEALAFDVPHAAAAIDKLLSWPGLTRPSMKH